MVCAVLPTRIMHLVISSTNDVDDTFQEDVENDFPCTEFDSHANMPVVGSEAYIIASTGKYATVHPYSPEYEPKLIPIVDAAVLYECPYRNGFTILVLRNALSMPSMRYNLIPPFIMREAGIQVKEVPKIHMESPLVEDHAIVLSNKLRIPLSLIGIFSYFPTSRPTEEQMMQMEEVYIVTPPNWNLHCDSFARNKEAMLDWNGELVDSTRVQKILMSEVPDGEILGPAVGAITAV